MGKENVEGVTIVVGCGGGKNEIMGQEHGSLFFLACLLVFWVFLGFFCFTLCVGCCSIATNTTG